MMNPKEKWKISTPENYITSREIFLLILYELRVFLISIRVEYFVFRTRLNVKSMFQTSLKYTVLLIILDEILEGLKDRDVFSKKTGLSSKNWSSQCGFRSLILNRLK